MVLTLNQALSLILTVAAVVVAVFLVLFRIQVRRTAGEAARALAEIREAAENFKVIEQKVEARIDDAAEIAASAKTTLAGLSEASLFLTSKVVRPASKYWPFLFPLVRLVWRQVKHRKEKRNV